MQIVFYTGFEKRVNSTKKPDSTVNIVSYTGEMRYPFTIENPVFQLKGIPHDVAPANLTYAYISKLSRYYFVREWRWVDGLWECSLAEDYLASWKDDIGATEAYVLRSASEYNGEVVDRFYPVTTDFVTGAVTMQSTYAHKTPTDGCYVLGILGRLNYSTSQAGGAVTYYVMTPTQMQNLMRYLLSDDFIDAAGFPMQMTTLQQLAHTTAKAFMKPIDYIISCNWFPVNLAHGNLVGITIGAYDIDTNRAQGYYLDTVWYTEHVYGQIPNHPQAETRGSYLNHAPYTRITVNIPLFGSIPVDDSFINAGDYIHGEIKVDPVTGKGMLRLTKSTSSSISTHSPIIYEANAMVGVPIQLAQIGTDFVGVASTALQSASSVAGNIASGGATGLLNTAESAFSGISDALTSIIPQMRTEGLSGSFVAYDLDAKMTIQWFNVTEEDNDEFGRPLCEVRQIDTLTGFIKCADAHIEFPCLLPEKEAVLKYLLSGFFWE